MTKNQAIDELARFESKIEEITSTLRKHDMICGTMQKELRECVIRAEKQINRKLEKRAKLALNERYGVRGNRVTANMIDRYR